MHTDDEIIKLLAQENTLHEGFSMLVSQYSEALYWKIRRIVLTHEDANDVLQNTFMKAWMNIGSFENRSKMSTWLFRIAINEALDFIRKNKKTLQDMSVEEHEAIVNQLMADEYFDGDEAAAQLQAAVTLLPDIQRTVFNLKYYENMKYSEISKLLNTSEGALKASYHLAVKKITEFFRQND